MPGGPPTVAARVRRYYLFQMLVAFQLWSPFWTLWLFAHADYFQSTLIDVVFWVVSFIVSMPAGAIADRHGRKRALLVGVAIWIVGIVLFGAATSFGTYALANGVWAFGAGFLWGAGSAYLYDTLVEVRMEARYPTLSSRVAMYSFLGTALASLLGGLLVAATGRFDLPLLVYALPGAAALGVALSFREPEVPRERGPGLAHQIRRGLRTAARNRQIAFLILFQVLLSLVTYIMAFFRPRFVEDIVQDDFALMGLIYTIFFCVAAAAGRGASVLLRRFGEAGSLAVTVLLVFPPFAVVYAISQGWFPPFLALILGIATQVCFYVVWGFESPVVTTILNRRVASDERATALAVVTFFDTLVMAIAEPPIGLVAVNAGFGTGLAALALAASLPTAFAVLGFHRSAGASAPVPVGSVPARRR